MIFRIRVLICSLFGMLFFSLPLLAGGEIADAGIDQLICSNSTSLAGNTPVTYTGLWTIVSGSGTFSDAADPIATLSDLQTGETVLVWEFYEVDVLISSDTVHIIVQEPPIANAGSDQTICSSATSLNATAASGGIWTVTNGSGTFADENLATTSVSGLATGLNVFRWTIDGGACADVFDEVSITVDENPTTATAGSDQTICSTSTTLDGNTALVGSGIWTVIDGSGTFTLNSDPQTAVSGLSTGINTFRWTISNGTCSDSFDEVSITVDETPTTATAGSDQTICSTSATLDGNTASIGTGIWTVVAGSGTFTLNSDPQTSVSGLTTGINTFRWTISNGTCTDSFDEVSITVDENPTTATAGSDQTICSTSATLDGNSALIGSGIWTVIAGSGTFTLNSDPQTAISGLSTGINTFRWTISNGSCTDSFDEVSITVDDNPLTPNAGSDQSVCSSTTALNATAATGGIWTVTSGSGTFADANLATTSVSGLSTGLNVFRWTIDGGSCADVFDEVSITVDENPTTSNAGSDQTICSTSATLDGNTALVGSGIWTVISGSGTFTLNSDPQTAISGLSTGINTFRWTISNGSCTDSFDEVSISVDDNPLTPNAGADQSVCSSSASLNATAATGGVWTVTSGSGTFTDENLATTSVSGLSTGLNVFRWTIDGGACADVFDEVSITVDETPTTANAGSDQTICSTSATLDGNSALVGTGIWTVISGSGTFSSNSNPQTSISGLSTGTNTFRWTISNGVCTASSDEVSITVQAPPAAPFAGTDQIICASSSTLNATAAAGGNWSLISGSGNLSNPSLANSNVTGLSNGANVFRWTVPGGVCADQSDDVTITVDAAPTTANAGTDQSICSTTSALEGNSPSTGTGLWTVISGTALFNDATNQTTSVSGLSVGSNVLRWTISNGSCTASFDEVTIVVDNNPVSPNAGPDQQLCIASTNLAATAATGGIWTVISGSGTFVNASLATTGVSGLSTGINVFRWTIPGGACGNVFDEVSITVDAPPTAANAGLDQSICATLATLTANTPTTGTGLWSVISGTALFNDATNPTTSVSGLSVGSNVLRWTISNGSCTASFDEVTIVVDNNPVSPNAGPDQQLCIASTSLAATAATGGIWTVISGSGTFVNASLATTGVSGLSTGINVFRWTIPGGACGNVFDEVSITVDAPPTTANAGSDQSICATVSTLTANTPTAGSGLWSVISGTALFNNAASPTTSVSGLSIGTNVLRWTISNGSCTASFDELTIVVDNNPVSPNAGPDQQLCIASTSLAATAATGGIWSVISGSGTFVNASLATTGVSGLSTGINVFRWTIPGGACGNVFDEVSITVDAPPTTANAGSDQSICATVSTLSANTPSIGTGLWTVVSGSGIFTNASDPTTAVSGLSVGVNILKWTISNGTCTATSDQVSITVDNNPLSPNAGTDQTICASSTNLAATAASGGVWTLISGTGTLQNASSASSSVSGLSIGTNVFRWTIPGGACGSVFDEVSILVQAAPSTANAGTDQVICSSSVTLAASSPAIGTGTWSLISGSGLFGNANSASSSVTGLSTGNNIFRWTVSNGVCTSSTDDVTITVSAPPSTPNAGSDQTICSSSSTLAASPSGGVWSLVSGTATFQNSSSATSSVSGLSTGINVLRWTIDGGACADVSDDVTITVQTQPSTANAGSDQSICSTSATLSANTPVVGSGLWTVISGSATFANATQSNTTVTGLSTGTNVLRWTISNGVCTASFDEVSIVVDANPSTPSAGIDQTICTSSTQLSASPATGTWTVVSGSASIQNASSATTTVSGLTSGTTVFRWTITSGTCPSSSDEVSITVQALPSTSAAGPDQTICTTNATLAANTPVTGSGIWTVINGSGTFSNANASSSTVSGLSTGTNTFRWTISNGVCPVSTDDVVITVQSPPATPNAGLDQTICSSTTNLSATAVTGGIWTVISGSGTFANASLAITGVTGLAFGPNVFRWTAPGGVCASVFDEVIIQVDRAPTTSNAGSNQSICSTVTQLTANTPLVGAGVWTVVSGTGVFANANDPHSSVSGLSVGANVLRWTISNGSCTPSQSTVTITVDNNPLSPNAGIDQLICTSTTTLSATAATGGSWSLVSGSGNIVSANTAITSVTGMTAGVNVFRWTIPGGSCGSVSDDVSIVVQNPPSTANAGSDQTICSSTTTLAASTPAVGNGTWTVVSGFATFSNANSPTSDVSGLNSGTTVLRWTITNGVCTSTSDDVSIFVTSAPATPSAGLDQTICSSTTSLSASPSGGIWTLSSGSGTIVNASSATTSVTGLTTGTSVFRWTIDGGTCPDVWDEVSITIQALPTTSAAGQDQTICSTSATLSANAPSIGSGQWSLISGSGTFANASLPNSTISGLGTGTNVLRWTISNGVCQASTDDVTITVDANPVTPSAGIDQTICSSSTQLSASPAGGTWTLVSGTGTFQNATSPTTQVSGLSTGVNILRWTVSNGSCADASDDVSITVQAAPTVSNAGVDQQVCATSTTLSGNIPTVGSGVWTVVSGTATFVNATSANTAVSGLSAGVNVLRWTISNGVCSSSVDEVTITVDSNPVSAFAGNDQSICSSTATLAATVATGGLWTLVSGSGTIVSATSANSSVTGLIVGTSVFRWTVSSGTCPAVSDEVSINVLNPPTTANAGSDQTICLSATTLAANTPSSGNGVWTVVSGSGFFANATQPNSNVSGLSTGVNILRWSISNGVCSPSTDEVSITVLQAPSNVQAGSDQIICGSSATLSASAPSQGSGHWTVVSGSGVFSNSNSETSGVTGISAGQNVFRWTVTNGSCASASDEVSVQSFAQPTTANAGSDQTICTNSTTLQGNFATIGTGTWTLISGSGVILNTSTPQTQVSNLTVGTHVFRWSISNGVCSPSTDEVTIQVLAPLVSDAGSDQDVCSSSSTFQATLPSGATGLWTLISGAGIIQTPTAANSQISNLGIGANVFQWSVNNGVCPVATSTVTINRFADPSAANAGIDFQTCANSANLAATTPSIGTGFWSVVTGSGTFSNPTLSNSAVTGLSAGINKLEWAISNGPCSIKRDTVIVTVDQNPTNAFAGSDQQLCTANSSFSATPASSGTGSWTVISGSGTIANANLATSAVTNLGAGANVFRWTVVSGTCTTFDEVILTRFLPPTTAVAGTNLIICSSSATLNANAPTIGTGLWTVLSGSGTFAQASNAGTTISNLGIGANVLSWTISNGVCPASVDQVTIDRQESPTTANAGLDQQICSDQIQLSGNIPSVGNGVWSLVSGTGTLENALSPSCVVSGLGAGSNVFQWSTLNGLCPASTDQVTITRDIAPSQADAGNDTSTCLSSIQLQASNPSIGTGVWSIVSGSGSFGNASSAQTNLNNLNPGITEALWTVSNGVCPSSSESIQITVYTAPQSAFAGIDEVICSDSIFLVGNTSSGSSYLWEVISGSAVFGDETAAQTALTSIAAGNSLIRYTITNGPCSSSDSVAILRYENPDLANAGLDSTFCSDVFVTQAAQPLIGQGRWFSADSNVIFSDSSAASGSVNLPAGISTLVWIVENGICPALSDTIVLQRDVPTELASAMSDTNVCAANLNIFAQSPTQAIGYWELISGDGVFIDSTAAQTELGMSAEGENVIVWTLEEGSCLSSDTVTIAFNYAPFPVSAGVDRSVCGLTTDLEGVSSGIGSGLWTFLNSDGTLSDPSDPIAFLTVDYTATRELIWTVTNGFCAVSDTVTLDFLDQPISDAGLDLIGCLNDTTALQAAIPSLGIGTWTVLTPGGNVFEPGFQNSNFTATEQGNFYLQWTVVNGICRDSSFTIVTIYGPDDPECSGPDVVFIPEGFSPNGDGVLDKLIIVKPQTKRVSLEVFDRYGILVYSSSDYQNDWDGTAQAGTILQGNQLPESTYYYLIQIEGELGVRKGYITLWR